ncbi:MAG TPA: aminotransferase class III-fold pyridoxal phosphate-dependent enzyme, partial [Candidatus Binataceae bacterium]|nr:aminotransferase class III-fold pyridoxal phosphate-dependent enzyme [Candidatus Binataceae bacterium]
GLPVGALGGSAEIMASFDPRDRSAIFHAGTFNGNPATCAAGFVSVSELTQARIDAMEKQAQRLASELTRAARSLELPFSVRQNGSLLQIFFLNQPPAPSTQREDSRAMATFHLAALTCGLFLAPRGLIALNTVMTDDHIAETVERAGKTFTELARAID